MGVMPGRSGLGRVVVHLVVRQRITYMDGADDGVKCAHRLTVHMPVQAHDLREQQYAHHQGEQSKLGRQGFLHETENSRARPSRTLGCRGRIAIRWCQPRVHTESASMIEILWDELTAGLPTSQQLAHVIVRLVAATLLGALVGYQRERAGKSAGLRTHTLVALGTTVFVVACSGIGMSPDGLSRVIQGVITGIGFLGAGSILKLESERLIQGLTTAAGIWMTAAIGVAVGLGSLGVALLATVMTLIVLSLVGSSDHPAPRPDQH